MITDRTNEQWTSELRDPSQRDVALSDLRALLVRNLQYALRRHDWPEVDDFDAAIEDFTQDALLKIEAALDSFRGESRFTTWAQKIAVRVALTELRHRRWKDVSFESVTSTPVFELEYSKEVSPEIAVERHMLLEKLSQIIQEELTERQRTALVQARINDMPIEEVARQLGTNRGALYKLLHDARKRLKARMQREGLTFDYLMSIFE